DGQQPGLHGDVDVVPAQAGEIRPYQQLAVPLQHLDVRIPDHRLELGPEITAQAGVEWGERAATEAEVLEEPVHLLREPAHEGERTGQAQPATGGSATDQAGAGRLLRVL